MYAGEAGLTALWALCRTASSHPPRTRPGPAAHKYQRSSADESSAPSPHLNRSMCTSREELGENPSKKCPAANSVSRTWRTARCVPWWQSELCHAAKHCPPLPQPSHCQRCTACHYFTAGGIPSIALKARRCCSEGALRLLRVQCQLPGLRLCLHKIFAASGWGGCRR